MKTLQQWRNVARSLVAAGAAPSEVDFVDGWAPQGRLPFDSETAAGPSVSSDASALARPLHVPKSFVKLAEQVSSHRDPRRWTLLYPILWRISHGQPDLLKLVTDDDVHSAISWQQQVRRDAHKMKAFVRFRRAEIDGCEWFIAWYRPDHRIVPLVSRFFADRFAAMNWSILCPLESVSWDQQRLQYGPGVGRDAAPEEDELESMWLTYYRSTFNPARIKLKAMRAQMPLRYWSTLPEAQLIDQLVSEAPDRVAEMVRRRRRDEK